MKEQIDILFVNSPMRAYDSKERDYTSISPLGEGYIATYLNERGFKARVLDAEGLVLSPQEIIDGINQVNPRWVGFNIYSPIANLVKGIIREVGRKNIVVGGSQATLKPNDTLEERAISIVVRGDAEEIMEEILLEKPLRDIRGISYRVRDSVCHNEQREQIQDLGKLPILDRGLFPVDPWDENGHRFSTVLTSRGCIYQCTFCAGPELARRKIRFRPMESVGEEVQDLIENQNVDFVRFMDDFFLVNEARSQLFIDVMRKSGLVGKFQWDAMIRADAVLRFSDEIMKGLKETGALFMAMGIETGNEERMANIRKGVTKNQVREAVQKLVKYGIEPKGYFMIGYPSEDEAEMWETINFARELRELGLTRATFNEIRPYPGTAMYNELLNQGWTEDELNAYQYVDLVKDTDDGQPKKHLLERGKNFTTLKRGISHVQPERVKEILREAILEF